ncbi:MAG TPA: beta-ketoacyl-[acyl-carrier-protein] synthase family protein [Nitrospirae bacterium]|nr:3-oxoacyl-[acyl-carrier-protein] synthase 2 [bacterium BMS3Abin10]GBE37884.1 3-oxoacyl-[acyl-carrier-protein] synthase 2 [bacterium BMS3Bbin08]HDK81080.1 beta-ketoacyl-[acyl-carrier-protein] synthase family protein [Nitrospirota bacterium]
MSKEKLERRVVITGYGMISPLGKNTGETFANARNGASGIDYLTAFDTRGLPCQIGGQVKNEWLKDLEDSTLDRFDKFSSRGLKLMRIATMEAARQARLDEIQERERIGVSLGSHGANPTVEDMMFVHRFYDGKGNWDMKGLLKEGGYPYLNFFRRKPDAAMFLLALLFNCKGSNLSIVSACAAGTQAVGEAGRTIRAGKSDVMIAGGCEADLDLVGFVGFVLIRALSEKYTTPQTASRPFDRKRNGFVMSEGAGAVILEELEHARSRGVPILGELRGYGDSADAFRITDTHPKGEGAILAMRAALDDASLTPDDIEYINAHGTSTQQNDLTETRAIKQVFGERAKQIPVSSNKSMLGHTIGAAGAIECILTLAGINSSVILPTINHEFRDPRCDLDYVPNEAREKEHAIAISNSFGFGGQNACLCVSRFEE